MASCRILDTPGYPTIRRSIIRPLCFFLICATVSLAQDSFDPALATIFFLEGNRDAALKYWNRVGKPRIQSVLYEPTPRADPALLDRALTFSPASVLRLTDLLTSEARTRQLGIFAASQFRLEAQPGG